MDCTGSHHKQTLTCTARAQAWQLASGRQSWCACFNNASWATATGNGPVVVRRREGVRGVLRDGLGVAAPVEGKVEAAGWLTMLLHPRHLEIP